MLPSLDENASEIFKICFKTDKYRTRLLIERIFLGVVLRDNPLKNAWNRETRIVPLIG